MHYLDIVRNKNVDTFKPMEYKIPLRHSPLYNLLN